MACSRSHGTTLKRPKLVRRLHRDGQHRQVTIDLQTLQAFHDFESVQIGHNEVEEDEVIAVSLWRAQTSRENLST